MPLSIFFIFNKDKNLELFFNGQEVSLDEIKKAKKCLDKFLKEITKEEINKYNYKIKERIVTEMKELNSNNKIPRNKIIKGYIYIIKSKNLYKIGRAINIRNRVKTYRTENPFGIKVILQQKVNDYIGIETKLLKKFKSKQVKGEWFKLNKQDIEQIKQFLLLKK